MPIDYPTEEIDMKLSPAKYAKEGGTRCPNCLSHNVDGGFISIDEGCATQPVSCLDCDATWTDVYKLSHYYDLTASTKKAGRQ